MNKDQLQGRVKEVAGKVKEVTGKVIGNKQMEERGKTEEVAGKVRAGFGDAKSRLNDKS